MYNNALGGMEPLPRNCRLVVPSCLNVKVDTALVRLFVGFGVPEPLDGTLAANVAGRGQGVGDCDIEVGYIFLLA